MFGPKLLLSRRGRRFIVCLFVVVVVFFVCFFISNIGDLFFSPEKYFWEKIVTQ